MKQGVDITILLDKMIKDDNYYMRIALNEAKKAYLEDEVPVGCCIVCDNKLIAKAHNLREKSQDVTMHAEIIAIKKACHKLNRWILDDCKIYITAEPCLMCAGAISQARIKNIIYGASSPKYGACESVEKIFSNSKIFQNVSIKKDVLKEEIETLMKDFFANLRKQ